MSEWKKIDPNVWKPEKSGDEIEGVLIKIDKESGKYKSTVYHIETPEQKQVVFFGSTVLDDRMSYIKIGECFKVVFRGTQTNAKKQEVKIYEVYKKD